MPDSEMQIQQNLSNLQYFKDRKNINLSFAFQIDSGKPGKHILIAGGMHGHEPVGVEAMVKFNNKIESGEILLEGGKITFIIGNPEAYKINKRLIDQNLNRAFLDDLESGIEGNRAGAIRNYLSSSKVDFVLDLHTVSQGEFQILAVYSQKSKQIALQISDLEAVVILHEDNSPGTLILEAEKRQIPAVLVECGNNTLPSSLPIAFDHIINTLIYFGNVSYITSKLNPRKILFHDAVVTRSNLTIYKILEPIKPDINFRFANSEVTTGTPVVAGEAFAFGDTKEYVASQDCVIFIPDHNPNPLDNDAGFLAEILFK